MTDSHQQWRCTICGYIHAGDHLPEECPICGAHADAFEPEPDLQNAPAAAAAVLRWRCVVCNYIHDGSEPPEACPICGAGKDEFEPYCEDQPDMPKTAARFRIVIAGGGIAGVSAAEAARRSNPEADIVLVSKEIHLPYYRINLTRFLAGEVAERDLIIHPDSWYEQQRIELIRGTELTGFGSGQRKAALAQGSTLQYDTLVLTSGSHALVPPLPGADRAGVFTVRTLDDAKAILESAEQGAECIVIGGGILGLETAGALALRGSAVTILEGHEYLMPRQLSQPAGEILARYIEGLKIRLCPRAKVARIAGEKCVSGVELEDGRILGAQLVIITAGVRGNTHLARQAGLQVNHGIIVNDQLQTSDPGILAAGDVAEHRGVCYGLWGAAQFQGHIAGMNAAGGNNLFGGIPRSNTLKVLGLDLFSVGTFEPADGSYTVIEQQRDGCYARYVFRDSRVVGAILLGNTACASQVRKAIETKMSVAGLLAASPTASQISDYFIASGTYTV